MSKQPLNYLILWLLPLFVSANFVNWLGNYDLAHQKVLHEHKPLLVLMVKKNDPLSSKVIKNSFMDQPYVDLINSGTFLREPLYGENISDKVLEKHVREILLF